MNGEGGYTTGYVIKVIAICDTKTKDTVLKNSKKELKLPPFSFLFVTSRFNGQTSFSLSLSCLFTITVPRMNLPRMTAQLAALTSQEQGSY